MRSRPKLGRTATRLPKASAKTNPPKASGPSPRAISTTSAYWAPAVTVFAVNAAVACLRSFMRGAGGASPRGATRDGLFPGRHGAGPRAASYTAARRSDVRRSGAQVAGEDAGDPRARLPVFEARHEGPPAAGAQIRHGGGQTRRVGPDQRVGAGGEGARPFGRCRAAVKHGTPSAVVSSWMPPESVSTQAARFIRARKSAVAERLDQAARRAGPACAASPASSRPVRGWTGNTTGRPAAASATARQDGGEPRRVVDVGRAGAASGRRSRARRGRATRPPPATAALARWASSVSIITLPTTVMRVRGQPVAAQVRRRVARSAPAGWPRAGR